MICFESFTLFIERDAYNYQRDVKSVVHRIINEFAL